MSNRLRFGNKIYLYSLLSIVTLFFASCGDDEAASKKNEKKTTKAAIVKVETIKLEDFTGYIDVIGQVKADKVSKVASATGGKIMKFNVDKGT
ncbi:MAG: efflux RND transporter periplasmic adaptor subunit, partial [Ignavibacteriaceae bacterium]|nr:efflux RND transporter periplasmic adaptor subunit [Ignavibacteriaceae bacterium]